MNKKQITIKILIVSLIFTVGCEDNKDKPDDIIIPDLCSSTINTTISLSTVVTTNSVNDCSIYFNFITGMDADSNNTWHLSVQIDSNNYNMPSIIFGQVNVAVYEDILFEDLTETPSNFNDDYVDDNSVFTYEGESEILSYDMTVHKVSVLEPDNVYVLYEPIEHTVYKLKFVEYTSGVTIFSFKKL